MATVVYIACSLDNYIAGPDGDLSWLPGHDGTMPEGRTDDAALSFETLMGRTGALLMGRNTYDQVATFVAEHGDEAWPYGERPVHVATHRPLEPVRDSVRAVVGDIDALVRDAQRAAGNKDVYLDGGAMIRAALAADNIDRLVLTVVPVALGAGAPLFGGLTERKRFRFERAAFYSGMMQLHLVRAGAI